MIFAKSSSANLRDVFRWEFARQVLLLIWTASVAVCAMVVAVSFLVTPESLDAGVLGWFGACPAKLAGRACSLCGMSHSFAAMAAGRWGDAVAFHAFGPALFLLFLLNAVSGTGILACVFATGRNAWGTTGGKQWA